MYNSSKHIVYRIIDDDNKPCDSFRAPVCVTSGALRLALEAFDCGYSGLTMSAAEYENIDYVMQWFIDNNLPDDIAAACRQHYGIGEGVMTAEDASPLFLDLEPEVSSRIGKAHALLRSCNDASQNSSSEPCLVRLSYFNGSERFPELFTRELKQEILMRIREKSQNRESLFLERILDGVGLYIDVRKREIATEGEVKIEELFLTQRGYLCLKRANINTLDDIMYYGCSADRWQSIRNAGSRQIREFEHIYYAAHYGGLNRITASLRDSRGHVGYESTFWERREDEVMSAADEMLSKILWTDPDDDPSTRRCTVVDGYSPPETTMQLLLLGYLHMFRVSNDIEKLSNLFSALGCDAGELADACRRYEFDKQCAASGTVLVLPLSKDMLDYIDSNANWTIGELENYIPADYHDELHSSIFERDDW